MWPKDKPPKNIDVLIRRVERINITMAKHTKSDKFKIHTATITSLISKLVQLKAEEVFGDEYPMDIPKLVKEGRFPVMCYNYDDDYWYYHSAYISAIMKKIYREKIRKKINRRIVFVFDDMGIFACPNRVNTSSKITIKKMIALGREPKIYVLGSVQNLTQIPEDILRQTKYFIFFGEISGQDLDIIAKTRKLTPKAVRERILYSKDKDGNYHPSPYRPRIAPNGARSCVVWKSGGGAFHGWVGAPSSYHAEGE